jgi:hypothetical protein
MYYITFSQLLGKLGTGQSSKTGVVLILLVEAYVKFIYQATRQVAKTDSARTWPQAQEEHAWNSN